MATMFRDTLCSADEWEETADFREAFHAGLMTGLQHEELSAIAPGYELSSDDYCWNTLINEVGEFRKTFGRWPEASSADEHEVTLAGFLMMQREARAAWIAEQS